jgi:hypothetical protein
MRLPPTFLTPTLLLFILLLVQPVISIDHRYIVMGLTATDGTVITLRDAARPGDCISCLDTGVIVWPLTARTRVSETAACCRWEVYRSYDCKTNRVGGGRMSAA